MKIRDLVNNQIAVHCDTKEKFNKFIEEYIKSGVSARCIAEITFFLATHDIYDKFKDSTCFVLMKVCDMPLKSDLTYYDVDNLINLGFKVIEFAEIELED